MKCRHQSRSGGHTGHEIARTVPVKETGVLELQLCEQRPPQGVDRILGSRFQQYDHQVTRTFPSQLYNQHDCQNAQQRFGIFRNDDFIH